MNETQRILIVDDEVQILRLLEITLESNGFKVFLAENAADGLRRTAMDRPDLVLLDLGLPDMDGMTVLHKIREWTKLPVIILSVRDSEKDIIGALDGGADDYLTKPFRTGELLARIRTALRHQAPSELNPLVRFDNIEVDLQGHTVKKNGALVKLTSTEFDLLAMFVQNAGKVLTHSYILEHVWGHAYSGETQYTRVFVSQLRKKLEDDPQQPSLFQTESGIGYRFAPEIIPSEKT